MVYETKVSTENRFKTILLLAKENLNLALNVMK